MVRWDLKIAIYSTPGIGSQRKLARRTRLEEAKISHLVQGHEQPTERERQLLKKVLGRDYFAAEVAAERRGLMEILADQRGCATCGAETKKDPK